MNECDTEQHQIKSTFMINSNRIVFILDPEILVTAVVGTNISLACNVTGAASWLKDGVNVTKADKRWVVNTGKKFL